MPGPLDGRVAAITGASSGIGEATALALSGAGAAVALGARRTDRIESLAKHILDGGGKAVAIEVDVGDEDQARTFVELAHSELGGLHALINNAGVMLLGAIEDAPVAARRDQRGHHPADGAGALTSDSSTSKSGVYGCPVASATGS